VPQGERISGIRPLTPRGRLQRDFTTKKKIARDSGKRLALRRTDWSLKERGRRGPLPSSVRCNQERKTNDGTGVAITCKRKREEEGAREARYGRRAKKVIRCAPRKIGRGIRTSTDIERKRR